MKPTPSSAAALDRLADIADTPARAEQFGRWLDRQPDLGPVETGQAPLDLPRAGGSVPVDHTAIRIPPALVARVDEVAARSAEHPATLERARNRSLVLRNAIALGLAELRIVGLRAPVEGLKGPPASPIGVRLPDALLNLADELAPALAESPAFVACSTPNRSGVLRVALALGLDELDRRHRAGAALARPHVAHVAVVDGRVVEVADDPAGLPGDVVEVRAPSAAALAAVVARLR